MMIQIHEPTVHIQRPLPEPTDHPLQPTPLEHKTLKYLNTGNPFKIPVRKLYLCMDGYTIFPHPPLLFFGEKKS